MRLLNPLLHVETGDFKAVRVRVHGWRQTYKTPPQTAGEQREGGCLNVTGSEVRRDKETRVDGSQKHNNRKPLSNQNGATIGQYIWTIKCTIQSTIAQYTVYCK